MKTLVAYKKCFDRRYTFEAASGWIIKTSVWNFVGELIGDER